MCVRAAQVSRATNKWDTEGNALVREAAAIGELLAEMARAQVRLPPPCSVRGTQRRTLQEAEDKKALIEASRKIQGHVKKIAKMARVGCSRKRCDAIEDSLCVCAWEHRRLHKTAPSRGCRRTSTL